MNVVPEQTKVEAGATQNNSSAVINDRTPLWVSILSIVAAAVAVTWASQSDKRHEERARVQDARINQLETQVLLAREDLRAIAPQNAQLRSFTESPKK